MVSLSPAPASTRFFLVLGLLALLISSGFLLLILGPTSYKQVQALNQHTYHEGGYKHLTLAVTPTSYQWLRLGLAAVAGLSGGLLLALRYFRPAALREDLRLLGFESRRATAALLATVRNLTRSEWWVAAGLLAVLLATRTWYLVTYVLSTDEVASYDYFVRPGLLTISSFYPIPNNHLLFNFACWPLSLLTDNVRLVMRLPTFVAAAAGTALSYVMLIRWTGFRVATLAVGFFGLLPLSLYYAVAGRGYFLQLTLLLLAFFAAVALLRQLAYQRLAWLVFVAASVLGFYTIPTFAYPFVSLGLGLLLGLAWQRRWRKLGQLVLAGTIIGTVTVLLYLPVVCVSGLRQLVGNHYVAKLAAGVFWPGYLGYLRYLADMLMGHIRLGEVMGGVLIGLGPLLVWQLPRPVRSLGALAWLLLALPFGLMAIQQVQVPPRVLLYLACFGCLLGSLVAVAVLDRLRVPGRYQLLMGLLLTGAYGAYQLQRQLAPHQAEVREEEQMQATYAWLTNWGGQRILLAAPTYELFFHHYAQQENRLMVLHSSPAPGQTYDFAVQGRGEDPLPAWVQPPLYTPVYENQSVIIYGRKTE